MNIEEKILYCVFFYNQILIVVDYHQFFLVKDILLNYSFDSSYFNSLCFYSYDRKAILHNENYQNKIAK